MGTVAAHSLGGAAWAAPGQTGAGHELGSFVGGRAGHSRSGELERAQELEGLPGDRPRDRQLCGAESAGDARVAGALGAGCAADVLGCLDQRPAQVGASPAWRAGRGGGVPQTRRRPGRGRRRGRAGAGGASGRPRRSRRAGGRRSARRHRRSASACGSGGRCGRSGAGRTRAARAAPRRRRSSRARRRRRRERPGAGRARRPSGGPGR